VERNYDRSVGEVIVERFSRLSTRTIPGVLVAHHGAFAWGSNVAETVLNSLALEQSAELAFGTLQLFPKAEALSGMLLDKYFEGSGK
jgi:L-ribulose-5-phosphate 4-epimerase